MLTPSKAIKLLIAAGAARVDLNNEQPHRPKIHLGMTIEAQAAELILHYQRRADELLETNNRYLERTRLAESKAIFLNTASIGGREALRKWLEEDHKSNLSRRQLEVDQTAPVVAQSDQWDEAARGPKMSDATGRVIFKYQMPVLEQFTMTLPGGAEIIRVDDDGGKFWLWALVNTDSLDEVRKFRAFKTGGKIPDDVRLRYVGFCAVFVQMELGLYIFEEVADA